jgi:hypothetical protein
MPAAQRAGAAEPLVASVLVVRRSWHVDVGFARAALEPRFAPLLTAFPAGRFVLFGFGDRHYLLSRTHGPSTLLAAIWPGPGMILLTTIAGTPQAAFDAPNVLELRLTATQLHALQDFIWHSLTLNDAPQSLAAGPYPGSLYFASTLHYSGAHTCNTWVAEALAAAGFSVHTRAVVLANQVWTQAQRLMREQSLVHESATVVSTPVLRATGM